MKLWEERRTNRCKITREHIGSIDSLSDQSLDHWLTRFILEVRKNDGSEFPPNNLHHITAGLMQHLQWSGKAQIDLFKDATFAEFRSSLDAEMKRLQSEGKGAKKVSQNSNRRGRGSLVAEGSPRQLYSKNTSKHSNLL